MFHPKTRPNWCKEVKCLTGSLKFRARGLLQSWIVKCFFSTLNFDEKSWFAVFFSSVKRVKNRQINFKILAQNFWEKKRYLNRVFYIVYSNYYCSKFLKCFHEQKASFIAIFLFLFAIYILFVRSILFPNNKLHQGLLQKRKIDPIELYAWLLSNRLFQYKIQRALLIFQFLTDCSNIRWFSGWKKMSFASIYVRISFTQIHTLSEKWNEVK